MSDCACVSGHLDWPQVFAIIGYTAVTIFVNIMYAWTLYIYNEINNPPLSPPGWLFPIVWGILYILMGVSSCIVYINKDRDIDSAVSGIRFYAISLIFNFVWSIIFFNLRMFLLAFIWLLALLFLIILTIVKYKRISPIASYLQIPYCLWVAFAGYLTLGTYLLN